jgi:tRNA 2-thiouridine synthesizing protein A
VTEVEPAREFNAGDKGCGEIAMELRTAMLALPPRAVLKLIAYDAGAPEDVPAWCRMTRHELLRAEPPVYWIQRREE